MVAPTLCFASGPRCKPSWANAHREPNEGWGRTQSTTPYLLPELLVIESKIDELIAALDRNTAAHAGAPSAKPAAAPAAAKPATAKPAAAPAAKTSAPAAVVAKAAAAADKALPAVDMKELGTAVTHVADDFLDANQPDEHGQPTNIGRPRVVALLGEFGAKKLNQVPAARLHEFATKVKLLAAELEGAAPAETTESLV